jgi:hypothetical protein
VLAAASRQTAADAFYGQTFVRDVAAATERVRTFLGKGPGMEAVADSVVAFLESVAENAKARGSAEDCPAAPAKRVCQEKPVPPGCGGAVATV